MKKIDIILSEKIAKEVSALKNRKINLSDKDAPEISDWEHAVVGKFYRPIKKQITIRVDADVLDWFKHSATKYQSLMNKACREYMEHHLHTKKSLKQKNAHNRNR